MPLDGSGFYSLPTPAFPAVPNTLIASADFNTVLNDVAQALSNCLYRDGQAIPNDDFDLGNNKIIRLAPGTAPTDAVNFSQFSALETLVEGVTGGLPAVIFPVGAIYITAGNTNPGTFLGGTWTQIAEGRTLIGVGTLSGNTYAAGATGGTASVSLTIGQMPAHDHGGGGEGFTSTTSAAGEHSHAIAMGSDVNGVIPITASKAVSSSLAEVPGELQNTVQIFPAGSHTHTISGSISVASQGSGEAHENRMPYLAVYFWQRTA